MVFKSFIETQFPISKISAESYKERKAGSNQTLTSLGKWWGRKPLILVRATILGILIPSSNDPKRDREIFLKILTLDEEGLLRRRNKNFTAKEIFSYANDVERTEWFEDISSDKPKIKRGISSESKEEIQKKIFARLPYNERINYCARPELVDGPSINGWKEINEHLGTSSNSIAELIKQLGEKVFGRLPKVGDSFSGGGSIPFEASRIGCDSYASDLNPIANLLTWASLNVVGGGEEVAKEAEEAQKVIRQLVDEQITKWGIEHNELGERADAYLYCTEVRCPESDWLVPLAPSWVIGEKTKTIAELIPDEKNKRYILKIRSGVSALEMKNAKDTGTIKNARLVHPRAEHGTPITSIRGDRRVDGETQYGLRLWENEDIIPRESDIFQERLYCIRWIKSDGEKYYSAPNEKDFIREEKVLNLISERFVDWQNKGYIPSSKILKGYNTDQPIRERGWTHWHHLFNPRQLLVLGEFQKQYHIMGFSSPAIAVNNILEIGRLIDTKGIGCKLLRWNPHPSKEGHASVFSNQALNTLYNYCYRTLPATELTEIPKLKGKCLKSFVSQADSRSINETCDIWITDPPYADAVNYHELSEFFLAWYEGGLKNVFPNWYQDSKRSLAIIGNDAGFRKSMAQSYLNLQRHTSNHGYHVVMFTHQDASVWADLTLVLWGAGLQVVSAWCVGTETDNALKEGNYVQGTVILVLKKQTSDETAFLDELYPKVEQEVQSQMESMVQLDDQLDPNFGDADYQLAAYAAALRVLTQYKSVEDIDISIELSRVRASDETSPIEAIISNAVRVACDYLVPKGFDSLTWKSISPQEKIYIKGLEIESHKEYRTGVYQELARGFGVRDYTFMLSSTMANQTRLKNATEFGTRNLDDLGFGSSLTRQILYSVYEIVANDENVVAGKNWLKNEVKDYWSNRKHLINIARYLAQVGQFLDGWEKDANAARLLTGAIENDNA